MAEETIQQKQETGSDDKVVPKEPTIKELMAQMDAVRQAQSGSDKKVKELSDALTQAKMENEELRTERMSEKEKASFEIEKSKREIEVQRAEIKAQKLALERTTVLTELEIPQSFARWVHGNSRDELIDNAQSLKAVFSDEVTKAVNVRLSVTPKPGGGDPPQPTPKFETFAAGGSKEFSDYLKGLTKTAS